MQNMTVTRISRRQGIIARGYVAFLVVRGNPQPLAVDYSLREISKKDSTY